MSNIRDILYEDLQAKEIIDICNIYYLINENEEKEDIYVEYRILKNKKYDYASGEAISNDIKVQIDIFSKIDSIDKYYQLERIIPKVLEAKDWDVYDEIELYETDTKLYHKGFRINKKIIV